MSPKLRVESQKDEHGHLNWLKIFRGNRNKPELQLSEIWDADGLTRQIIFDGKREAMPSVMDIVSLFHQSFIERIGLVKLINLIETIETVETIDLVSLISLIAEVTNIKNIESVDLIDLITEITKIGSVKVIGKDASNVARRSTIENHGTTALWVSSTGAARRGKFFTSHCMGFITNIQVYCKDAGAAGGTITVYISPNPNVGYVDSATIVPGAGGAPAWRTANFKRFWPYDKLFIFVVGSTADMVIGYDNEDANARDGYYSSDSGASWGGDTLRCWFKVTMIGETEGDNNVTGTVNTIDVPSESSSSLAENVTVPDSTWTDLLTLNGAGESDIITFVPRHSTMVFRFLADGEVITGQIFTGDATFNADELNAEGYTITSPLIHLVTYAINALCRFNTTVKFRWQRQFKVQGYQITGGDVQFYGSILYHKTA